jgi:CBS domain-containing protein
MSLERFCRKPVVTMEPKQSIRDAAVKMREQHVGAILIVEGDRAIGIVTDRDIVLRVVADGRDIQGPVRDIMSRSVQVVHDDDKIDDAVNAIRGAGVRRVPIVDARGKPVGMVTLDDLVVLMAGELSTAAGAVRSNRGP